MAFTTEAIDLSGPVKNPTGPAEFDLPVKEFIGYDPKGTMSITGSPIQRPNPKQEAPSETKVDAESPKAEESVTLSPKISAIARKEQVLLKRERDFAMREKALEAKLADAEKYSQLKTKVAAKDYSAAEELGLTYDEFVKHELNKKEPDPTEQKFRTLEEKLSQFEKAQEEKESKEYQANQSLWKQEISKLVSESEEFSTIRELKMEEAVLRHVNDSFEEDGIELTAEQAAKEIEEALVERAEKFASVTKIRQKYEAPSKVLGPPKSSPKTITQNMTVTSEKHVSKPFHLMSESEQIAEAYRRVQAAKLQR